MSTTPTPAATAAAPTTLDAKTIELVQLVVKTTLVELQQPTTTTSTTAAPDTERKAAGAQYLAQLGRK